MAIPAPIGMGLQLGGLALSAVGGLQAAKGQAAGYQYAAAAADRKARAARTAADETDAALRDELQTTLGNIEAVRAAANVTPDSPTGIALLNRETDVSDRQRQIRVANLRAQGAQSESDALFYRYSAGAALQAGQLGVFGKTLSGLAAIGRAA
jgi:hypothetical protein